MFAITLFTSEILLQLLAKTGTLRSLSSGVLFALSVGLCAEALFALSGKKRWIPELLASVLISVYFSFEAVVKEVFGIYFSIGDAVSRAGNVTENYGEAVKESVISGCGKFLLFMLPWIILIILRLFRKVRKPDTELNPERKKKPEKALNPEREQNWEKEQNPEKEQLRWRTVFTLILLSVLTYRVTSVAVSLGPDSLLFTGQYSFHNAAEKFGLTESTLLSFFRDPEETGFILTEEPATRAEVPTQKEPEAETAPPTTNPSPELESNLSITASDPESKSQTTATEPASKSEPELSASGNEPKTLTDASGAASKTAVSTEPETEAETAPPEPVIEYNVMDLTLPGEEVSKKAKALSDYILTLEPSVKNEYTGIFRGKNLIMICAESYCDAFLRPELTPTLWRLTHNGFYFPEFYQPSWGGSTTTGELSMILGLDSNEGNEALQDIADNDHRFSMGNQLRKEGYFSMAFHNGSHTFYRRDLTHEKLGYDAFYASGQDIDRFCGHSYPSDSEMIEGTLPEYIGKSPFSIYYMTVSGHAPYEKSSPFVKEFLGTVNEVLGEEYYEKTKYYICYQMELEKTMTALVEGLEEAGIADDTVIVLTSDHYPYGLGNGATWHNDRDYINDLIKGKDSLPWNEDKTGLIIWSGCLEHEQKDLWREIDEPVVSLDILPTLSNLFGLEFDSRLLPGRDVFAGTKPLVYWNNLSWVTDKGKYNTKKHEFTPAEGYEPTEEELKEYIASVNTEVSNRIRMSASIMNLDYYRLVFGEPPLP